MSSSSRESPKGRSRSMCFITVDLRQDSNKESAAFWSRPVMARKPIDSEPSVSAQSRADNVASLFSMERKAKPRSISMARTYPVGSPRFLVDEE